MNLPTDAPAPPASPPAAAFDPYYRRAVLTGTQFVQASRPIVLTQDGDAEKGVVSAAPEGDVVIFADLVTIRGPIKVRRPGAGPATPSSTGDMPPAQGGGRVIILARRLDTERGDDGDAALDLSGDAGPESTVVWAAAPPAGKTGDDGVGIVHSWDTERPGGPGQSSLDASGKWDPTSPLNGKPGDKGGPGGDGGVLELRCGSLADSVALAVVASGGPGANGQNGQPGAQGGDGGPGDKGGWDRGISAGGNGGRGGNGGDGGAPGEGGAPGTVSIWLRAGNASAVTPTLVGGTPGNPGTGGAGGGPGGKGAGGHTQASFSHTGDDRPDGQPGAQGDPGTDAQPLMAMVVANKPAITAPLKHAAPLVAHLDATWRLVPQLAMTLDLMRVDFLRATGDPTSSAFADLADRLDWVRTLARIYQPLDVGEQSALDVVRGRLQTVEERVKKRLDYFGGAPSYAPLGSIDFYYGQFTDALKTLQTVYKSFTDNVEALDAANAGSEQVDSGIAVLQADKQAYIDGQTVERAKIADLITQISGHDGDVIATRSALVSTATAEFIESIRKACGLDLNALLDCMGQMAFLGEKEFQQSSMYGSQGLKLLDTAASTCLADDGTQVDKSMLINRLGTVANLTNDLNHSNNGTTIDGITLGDPGNVKLVASQADLDQLCTEFWSYPGARDLKDAFDQYVQAVQARNADIISLNGSLAVLRGYKAGAAQCDASLVEAQQAKSDNSAPGAPAVVTQLARMVSRATDDCIYELYQMSRALWMWSLKPGDELAKALNAIAGGDVLGLTPDVLSSAGEQLHTVLATLINQEFTNAGEPIPNPADPNDHSGRGIEVTFSHDTHPTFVETLRKTRTASIAVTPARKDTKFDDSPFNGKAEVRITKVRAWVYGVKVTEPGAGPKLRIDLEHSGHETVVGVDDVATVVTHDRVEMAFEYNADKPDDPTGIVTDGDLFNFETGTGKVVTGAPIGPFTKWRITIPDQYNPKLDLSQVDKVVFEFFGHQRPFPVSVHAKE